MATPQIQEVQAVLSDFEERLRGVVDRGWKEWSDSGLMGRLIFKRTGSNNAYDMIARHAVAEFDEDPLVHVINKPGTIMLLVRDQVLIRFKKGNAKGVGSNIETQAVLDFVDPNADIPGLLPELMKVEVCYQTDFLGKRLEDVAVVARNRSRRVWAYPLRPAAAGEIIPLPQLLPPDTTPVVITPKKSSDEVAGEE